MIDRLIDVSILTRWWKVLLLLALLGYYIPIAYFGLLGEWYVHIYPVCYYIALYSVKLHLEDKDEKKKKKVLQKARDIERASILMDIDKWTKDKSSAYDTRITGSISNFIERLQDRFIAYFREQPDRLNRLRRIYKNKDNSGVKYQTVLIELRALLDETTDISNSDLFIRPNFDDNEEKRSFGRCKNA